MHLFDFLVTSQTRKELLKLLWVDNLDASGHQLAQLAQAAYSAVHSELEAMKNEGVFLVPGDCFGMPNHFRIGFGAYSGDIRPAMQKIQAYLRK